MSELGALALRLQEHIDQLSIPHYVEAYWEKDCGDFILDEKPEKLSADRLYELKQKWAVQRFERDKEERERGET